MTNEFNILKDNCQNHTITFQCREPFLQGAKPSVQRKATAY